VITTPAQREAHGLFLALRVEQLQHDLAPELGAFTVNNALPGQRPRREL
jgi:hypothetical protein